MKRFLPAVLLLLLVVLTTPTSAQVVQPQPFLNSSNARAVEASGESLFSFFSFQSRAFPPLAAQPFTCNSAGFKGLTWFDTVSNVGKLCNGSAWVTLSTSTFAGGAVTSPITGPDGTAGAPTFAFTSDADGTGTGFFRSSANAIGVSTNGTERWTFNASGGFNCTTDGGCVVGNGAADPQSMSVRSGGLTVRGLTSGSVFYGASTTGGNSVIGNLTLTNPASGITATFPTTSFTAARTDAGQNFVGNNSFAGVLSVLQSGGVAGTDEIQLSHDGTNGLVQSKDGQLRLRSSNGNGIRIINEASVTNLESETAHMRIGSNTGSIDFALNGVHVTSSSEVRVGSGGKLNFSSNASPGLAAGDAGFARAAAASIKPTNGSTGYGNFEMASGVTWRSGAGSPEGVVTASVGSLYTRTDGGASTTLYVKESGTGNTGWVAK